MITTDVKTKSGGSSLVSVNETVKLGVRPEHAKENIQEAGITLDLDIDMDMDMDIAEHRHWRDHFFTL